MRSHPGGVDVEAKVLPISRVYVVLISGTRHEVLIR